MYLHSGGFAKQKVVSLCDALASHPGCDRHMIHHKSNQEKAITQDEEMSGIDYFA